MIRRILCSRIFVLFLSMLIVGFLIGYTYSLVTSPHADDIYVNTSNSIKNTGETIETGTGDGTGSIMDEP